MRPQLERLTSASKVCPSMTTFANYVKAVMTSVPFPRTRTHLLRFLVISSTSSKYPYALSAEGMSGRFVITRSASQDSVTMMLFKPCASKSSFVLQGIGEVSCAELWMKFLSSLRQELALCMKVGSDNELKCKKSCEPHAVIWFVLAAEFATSWLS